MDEITSLDFSHLSRFIPEKYKFFFNGYPGFAPYRLLAYSSTLFNNKILIEVGVHNGWGSLAMSFNKSNTIVGYDINISTLDTKIRDENPNITFKEGISHEIDPEIILNSPFIHLDTLHDGVYEGVFIDFLAKNNYKGVLLADDIHLNQDMEQFWESIKITKYDLTAIGHETGSGLVCFDNQELYIK